MDRIRYRRADGLPAITSTRLVYRQAARREPSTAPAAPPPHRWYDVVLGVLAGVGAALLVAVAWPILVVVVAPSFGRDTAREVTTWMRVRRYERWLARASR